MEENKKKVDAILVHIEHSKPIEIDEFICSMQAIGGLFSNFVQKKAEFKEQVNSKLYVEKIENGCIDIFLTEVVTASIIPFMENMNVILEFSGYIKSCLEYYTKGIGTKPKTDITEAKNLKDLLTITAGDNNGSMQIGAINKADKLNVYSGCTFNFTESNSAQNQLEKDIKEMKEELPTEKVHSRVLMTIYQMRGNKCSDVGNKAIIDDIAPNKVVALLFDTDDLKSQILYSDENPAKKAYSVDVVEQTAHNKLVAYKVIALHDVIDLED